VSGPHTNHAADVAIDAVVPKLATQGVDDTPARIPSEASRPLVSDEAIAKLIAVQQEPHSRSP
jgi:hypothetical protein